MSYLNSASVQMNSKTDLIIEADPDGIVQRLYNKADGTEYIGDLAWLGTNVKVVKEYDAVTKTLADTAFNTWTPSTTAANIINAVTKDTIAMDAAYDYIAVFDFVADIKYSVSQASGQTIKASDCVVRSTFAIPATVSELESDQTSTFTTTNRTYRNNVYATSSTAQTLSFAATYDTFFPDTAFTTTSGSNIVLSEPAIKVKCNTTAFTTAQAANVDKDASTVSYKLTLYRAKRGSNFESAISVEANRIFNEGI